MGEMGRSALHMPDTTVDAKVEPHQRWGKELLSQDQGWRPLNPSKALLGLFEKT